MRTRASSFAFASLLIGCGVERIEGGGNGACVAPPVQMIFDARCLGASCHSSGGVNVSLAAGESAAIIDGASKQSPLPLVALGSIEGSYLAHKIMAVPPTPIEMDRMPQNGDFDDPELLADMALVLGWIGGADLGPCANETDNSTGDELLACGVGDLDPGGTSTL